MKKRTFTVLGISLLVAILAIPVIAWAMPWGAGPMMGNWGMMGYGYGPHYGMMGYGYGPYYGWGPGTAVPEQVQKLRELERKYFDETTQLRNELWQKSSELSTLLTQANPDPEKAKALQREIDDIRSKLSEKGLEYRLEARKITPSYGVTGGYGYHMGGYGPGTTCWY
ncbi:MAG: Spy/CpxP family protein refolding chaperone [Deltaproteobacteria bacterium]|nr:Spy/CpxP family protein refolding chaperone [Deltaproteobacteria bacterium]